MTIAKNGVLHADTASLEEISELALVACDASYLGLAANVGASLGAFDDTPQENK